MHDKRNKDKGWREFPSSGKSGAEERGAFRHGRSRISGIFSSRNSRRGNGLFSGASTGFFALSGGGFSAARRRAGSRAVRSVRKERYPGTGVRECLYPVWDFPAVSAIGTSRRAGPLAGGSNTACPGKAR